MCSAGCYHGEFKMNYSLSNCSVGTTLGRGLLTFTCIIVVLGGHCDTYKSSYNMSNIS
jgi:hypothetical protein